jgi:hypothetical protein
MPLGTYEEVRPWAQAIQERVLDGTMPPWFAEPGSEPLSGAPLTAREIDALSDWAAGGAPPGVQGPAEGGRSVTAEIRAAPEGGLESRSISLEARGGPIPVAEDLHLAAWWLEPRDGPCPRAAVLRIDPPAREGGPEAVAGSWVAGQGPFHLPAGTAFRVAAGSTLRLEVLPGKGPRSAARDGAGRILLHLALLGRAPGSEARAVTVEGAGAVQLRATARVVAALPLGDGGPARLVLRGGDPGREKVLLEVSRSSAEWPISYAFVDPPSVGPEGKAAWEPAAAALPSRLVLIYTDP